MSGAGLREVAKLLAHAPDAAARVERLAAIVEAAPKERRAALLAATGVVEPALGHVVGHDVAALCAALEEPWPELAYAACSSAIAARYAARLLLGERPADLAPGLTAAEAAAWLREAPLDAPADWLLATAAPDMPVTRKAISCVRVARWLLACWRDPPRREALIRERAERVAGELVRGRYIDRADELRRADLRPSVAETFRRAGARIAKLMERSMRSRGEPLIAPPRWWRPARCARILLSAADLAAEGRALQHCVASYAPAVRSGRSVIVGLCVLGARSTAELDRRTANVRQHKGAGNAAPPALNQRALEVLVRRWRAAAEVR
jgi:hypothetical protein